MGFLLTRIFLEFHGATTPTILNPEAQAPGDFPGGRSGACPLSSALSP
jgi:hypothetical protein